MERNLDLLICTLPLAPLSAAVDPDAEVLLVRKDCAIQPDPNCFDSLGDALDWTWNTRNPTSSSPLTIDLGPGQWNETWVCPDGRGFVTTRGSGRDATFINGDPAQSGPHTAVDITNCERLEFTDMTIQNPDWAVHWSGGGSSTWTDVDIVNLPYGDYAIGWIDDIIQGQEDDTGLHYFFGCRVRATGRRTEVGAYPSTPYWASASETWFFGGEILWDVDENGTGSGAALVLNAGADFRAFGTAIRARALAANPPVGGEIVGVSVSDAAVVGNNQGEPAVFHMHGGIINASVVDPASTANAIGLKVAGANSTAHTPETAFVVKANPPALSWRLFSYSGSKVLSPYLWQSGDAPPVASFYSANGQDMYIETDCDSAGDCDCAVPANCKQAHLMIYNPAHCGYGNPWLDSVTGRCRNDTGP